jgi:hypothetical protein
MVMLAFQPIRVGMLDTLNCSKTFSSSMQKHALIIFLYKPYLFCAHMNIASAVLICTGNANYAYTATAPGSADATNELGSSSAYTIGNKTKPDHPWIVLWVQTSCLSALTMYFHIALSFAKSGRGESVGGFLRNSGTSLYSMRWSIFW